MDWANFSQVLIGLWDKILEILAQQWIGVISIFIAVRTFFWQRQDRQEKKRGKKPSIHIKRKEISPIGDWIPLELICRNDNDFTIIITKISVSDKSGFILGIGHYQPYQPFSVRISSCKEDINSSTLNVEYVLPSKETSNFPSLEKATILAKRIDVGAVEYPKGVLIRPSSEVEGLRQVEISFTYHSTLRKDKKMKIKVASEPIRLEKNST